VLAVFDAARRAGLLPAHRSSRYRSNKALGYAVGTDGALEGMRFCESRMREGSDGRKLWEEIL